MKPPSTQPPGKSEGDPPEEDDRTLFAPAPVTAAPEGTAAPAGEEDDDDRTEIAPLPTPKTAATVTQSLPDVGVDTTINNNYRITEVLSSGGMGSVYRGVEIGTGDPVAIKAILPELAEDKKAGLLFKREARTLRQLADEAIVRYYNYVHDSDLGRYFLVMEFIEGVPLADHLKQEGALSEKAVVTLLERLSKGLSKAHAKEVIHRDLSPDNVMLSGGDVAQARIIDFGIAKSNVVKDGTMHGQFAGKFKYVSPEQLGHFDGVITPATDIYGLGLLAAAAAAGQALDMGDSVAAAVQSRQQIPDLTSVPAPLRPILSHMLEPNPANRPASMEEVRRMLDAPELIPVAYRAGVSVAPARTGNTLGQSIPPQPLTTPPPGLQVPMMTAPPTTVTQAPTQTVPPQKTLAPQEVEKSGNGALGLLLGAFVVVAGGVGFVAWQSGMLGESGGTEVAAPQGLTAPAPRSANTRAGFLAAFESGACTYLTRVAAGAQAGMIEGFSRDGTDFPGLPVAYEEQFGARPAILPRDVTEAQCPALEFARTLQGRDREAPQMQLSSDRVVSGEAIRARIAAPAGQAVWAALVTPAGGIFNLTERLSDPLSGQRTLDFGLNLAPGAEATPQLLLIVTSDRPLARTATAADGAVAAELLPLILEEIDSGSGAAANLGYVLLEPPADGAGD